MEKKASNSNEYKPKKIGEIILEETESFAKTAKNIEMLFALGSGLMSSVYLQSFFSRHVSSDYYASRNLITLSAMAYLGGELSGRAGNVVGQIRRNYFD